MAALLIAFWGVFASHSDHRSSLVGRLTALRGGSRKGGIDHSNYSPPDEWAPLVEAELRLIKLVRMRFRGRPGLHDDLLLEAVRGFEHAGDGWQEATEVALEQILHKRAAVDADAMLTRGVPRRSTFCSLYLCGHHGFDREGHPLYFERTGAINPRQLFSAFDGEQGEDELLVNHVFVQEAMRAIKLRRTAETGRRIYKHIAITDLKGLNPSHLSKRLLRMVKRTLAYHEAAYPETLHTLYIVNAPALFAFAWKLISPWLHPLTASKVRVLGGKYLEEFRLAGIEVDQVPAFLGGEGGELEQFWEAWEEGDIPTLDHFLQTTVPGAELQDLGDALVDEGASIDEADAQRLRATPEAGSSMEASALTEDSADFDLAESAEDSAESDTDESGSEPDAEVEVVADS